MTASKASPVNGLLAVKTAKRHRILSVSDNFETDSVPPLADNRVFVLVLQHPQERREPLATAAITIAALRRAKLVIGLSWPSLSRILDRPVAPRRWGVPYLAIGRASCRG